MTSTTTFRAGAQGEGGSLVGAKGIAGLVVLLLVSVALPFIFLPMEASWGHLAFHLIGIVVCTLAVMLLRGLRRASASKVVRVLTWVATVAYVGWTIGHVGELGVVVTHGGAHADQHVFEHPVHTFFATISIPSWMAAMAMMLVLLVAVIVHVVRRPRR